MEDKEIYQFIGRKIKELRTTYGGKGIKQEDLAKEIGVLNNSISRWETGAYKPKINDLTKLAKFFNVSIGEFFPLETGVNSKDEKLMALTRISGDLPESDLEELIEYAKFRQARQLLNKPKKSRTSSI